MRTIHVIGIGAGDPDYVTAQAVGALNGTDVFFAMDKGEAKSDLVELLARTARAPRPDVVFAHFLVPAGLVALLAGRAPVIAVGVLVVVALGGLAWSLRRRAA